MSKEKAGGPDWAKLPVTMQHQFFEKAEKEAKKAKHRLLQDADKLKELQQSLKFRQPRVSDDWKDWIIGAVDGSDSPVLSERIGVRYGTYGAGYMTFKYGILLKEDYDSGHMSSQQVGDPELSKKILELLTVKMEREKALEISDNVDVLLFDGSFFAWRAGCHVIRDEPISLDGYTKVAELIDEVRELTFKLLNTGKSVGIIKRVRTAAIDGWIACTKGENSCLDRNDRAILAYLMPPNSWFAYQWLFKPPEACNYYPYIRHIIKKDPTADTETLIQKSRERFVQGIRPALGPDDPKDKTDFSPDLLKTTRYYYRATEAAPPFSFETHKDMPIEKLLGYFQAPGNINKATGLPFPIDLIDENVSLPAGFTNEFVEEIEAQLIQDPELDKLDLSNSFAPINPQKKE